MTTRDEGPARNGSEFYYIRCPRCDTEIRQPYYRSGGPQITTHCCGHGHRPRNIHFLVTASGNGYLTHAFERTEKWEPVLGWWIHHWEHALALTVG